MNVVLTKSDERKLYRRIMGEWIDVPVWIITVGGVKSGEVYKTRGRHVSHQHVETRFDYWHCDRAHSFHRTRKQAVKCVAESIK